MSIAYAATWEQRWEDLGKVPMERIRTDPPPGQATLEDVVRLRETERRLFELVDGTLVEKAMGWQESLLAAVILHWLQAYLDQHPLGVATGADGMTRLFDDTIRSPDVAFVHWNRLPGGQIPSQPIPDLVPNFVVEVLSVTNTYSEMSRKRREYFHAGVEMMWLVHPRERTLTYYLDTLHPVTLREGETLKLDQVLPGWEINTGELFRRLDGRAPGNADETTR